MKTYTYKDKVSGKTLYVKEEDDMSSSLQFYKVYKDSDFRILHREDGPAIEYSDGEMHWFQNNKYHRLDGPAVIQPSGLKEWWVNDIRINKKSLTAKQSYF
jgi:hypothetical protein